MPSKHIGLIGGIGPAATVAYYRRLTDTFRDRGGQLELTIVHAQTPIVAKRAAADLRAEQAAEFADLVVRLKAAGADYAALTSIGAHFCFAELSALSPLPLVSAIEPLDVAFAGRGLRRVGLLGTAATMRTRLFGQLRKTEAIVLDDQVQELGDSYIDMAITGTCRNETRDFFLEAGRQLMKRGAEAVVLAGTDLGLAFDGVNVGYPVIDALEIHVAALADLAAGR